MGLNVDVCDAILDQLPSKHRPLSISVRFMAHRPNAMFQLLHESLQFLLNKSKLTAPHCGEVLVYASGTEVELPLNVIKSDGAIFVASPYSLLLEVMVFRNKHL